MTKKNNISDIYLEDTYLWEHAQYLDEGLVLSRSIESTQSATRMNFILMALCMRGKADYSIDTHQLSVNPGDLMFVSERHIVDYFIASDDFECQCILVSTTFYHDFVQNVKNVSSLLLFSTKNPVVRLTQKEIKSYSYYFESIREKMADIEHPYRIQLVKALLLTMFYDMSGVIYRVEKPKHLTQTRAESFFAEFINLLEGNYRTIRRVSWYAEQLNITPKYLSEIVKHVSARTTAEWIDSYVILELRVLLQNSTKSIKEIAAEMNFPNQSFLGKYFKEHVGMSPSQFRKNKV